MARADRTVHTGNTAKVAGGAAAISGNFAEGAGQKRDSKEHDKEQRKEKKKKFSTKY